jgi:DNA-binding CsgD family transcriptional regulator/DNA-binding MarR family transcriptional regulator
MAVTKSPEAERALRGRAFELAALEHLLDATRAGHGGTLVLQGEAGIGKTALLQFANNHATGFRLLRAEGAEFEMELPFAALHQLCLPVLERLEYLPEPHRDALTAAFGLRSASAPDPFMVGAGLTSLLSDVANEGPLLCVLDDAQWLDQASARALAFAARRIDGERVAMLFSRRDASPGDALQGLPCLELGGMDEDDARELLASEVHVALDVDVVDRIIDEARGNPLALLELPRGGRPADLAGAFALSHRQTVSATIEASFRRRIEQLPLRSRRLLLLAAAEPLGHLPSLREAAERLGLDLKSAASAEADGLIELGRQVRFRHPLARSAVYLAATPAERREAHLALGETTDPELDFDRRSWHLALASAGPDEAVAQDLERSADRANARGGVAAAAAFLELAAQLTPGQARAATRALGAARAKFEAGDHDAASRLLTVTERHSQDGLELATVGALRARAEFQTTRSEAAAARLLRAAVRIASLDEAQARETFMQAFAAAMYVGRFSSAGGMTEVAEAVRESVRVPSHASPIELLLAALTAQELDGYVLAAPALRRAVDAFAAEADPAPATLEWMWMAAILATDLWDEEAWRTLSERQVQRTRHAGLLGALPGALRFRALAHTMAGELADAAVLVAEAHAIERGAGGPNLLYADAALVAWRGERKRSLSLLESGRREATSRGEGRALSVLEYSNAVLLNGLGHYDAALAAARRVCDCDELGIRAFASVELIEAAVYAGNPEFAVEELDRLSARAAASGTDWAVGVQLRSRALLCGEPDAADGLFLGAIERLERTAIRTQLARAHLVYGEWLRRASRRRDARAHLTAAHDMLTSMGAGAFAARAARELRAIGQRARARTPGTVDELTVQELQVAQLVATGATNKEAASELFVSARTIDAHLRSVFRKLNVTSRRQLRELPQLSPKRASHS